LSEASAIDLEEFLDAPKIEKPILAEIVLQWSWPAYRGVSGSNQA